MERLIRTIQGRARATLFSLPYTLLPACRVALFLDTAVHCNLLPTEATGSRSPREIFTGIKLDVSNHLRAEFSEYVLMKTRTPSKQPDHVAPAEAGLIVGRDLDSKGGVKVFVLRSNQINQILPRDSVIAQINSLPDNLFSDDGTTTQSPANAIARTAPPLPGVPSHLVRVLHFPVRVHPAYFTSRPIRYGGCSFARTVSYPIPNPSDFAASVAATNALFISSTFSVSSLPNTFD